MSDEVRVTSATGGQKGRKLAQIGAIDPLALLALAEVAGKGAEKYARFNYLKGYDWSLSYDAAQRHLMLFQSGQDYDAESGQAHLAHAAWHCLAMLSFQLRALGTDDRPPAPNVALEPPVTTVVFDEAFVVSGDELDDIMARYFPEPEVRVEGDVDPVVEELFPRQDTLQRKASADRDRDAEPEPTAFQQWVAEVFRLPSAQVRFTVGREIVDLDPL